MKSALITRIIGKTREMVWRIRTPSDTDQPAALPDRSDESTSSSGFLSKAFSLTYVHGGLVRRFQLGAATATIGRAPGCTVRINGRNVDPVHCRLERTKDDELILFSESEESTLLVDGVPVEFMRLNGGETITLGDATLRVHTRLGVGKLNEAVNESYTFENNFGRLMVRSIRKSHWLLLSCITHLSIVLLVSYLMDEKTIPVTPIGFVQDGIGDSLGEFPLDDDLASGPSEYEFDDPVVDEFDALEDLEAGESMAGVEADRFDEDLFGNLGQDGTGLDAGGNEKIGDMINPGRGMGKLFGKGSGWSEHVGTLRSTGLDIAIIFDSTGSMVALINEVKPTINEMVKALHRIVPDLRIALITYKGNPGASDYVVAGTPFVNDLYELLNFMNSVDISGGSAEGYAAIDKGLGRAVNKLEWRDETQKAIVLIGDAAPFPRTVSDTLHLVRRFDGRVSTIYKNSEHTPGYLEPTTLSNFRGIARAGKGDFIRYDVTGDVVQHVVTVVLGSEFADQIRRVFAYQEKGPWKKVLARRAAEGDIDWLLKQMMKKDSRPEVADALLQIGGKALAARIWRLLQQGDLAAWELQRCVYILSELTNVHINYIHSSRKYLTQKQMQYIKDVLTFLYGKRFPK